LSRQLRPSWTLKPRFWGARTSPVVAPVEGGVGALEPDCSTAPVASACGEDAR
jgi:hypothetical protein